MTSSLHESAAEEREALRTRFDAPLRAIARRAVRIWFNRDRVDQLLSESIGACPQCSLLYAIDTNGRQVSSNVYENRIDPDAYGQDLSHRPYAVSLSVLNNPAYQGAFLCEAYISRVTQRPCVTVMCAVTSGPTTLGFIAADLEQQDTPSA